MKRYLINNSIKKDLINKDKSIRELNRELGFEVRSILYKNSSINEKHLRKLENYFNKSFNLKRVYLDYGKNFGKFFVTEPINSVKVNGDLAEFIGIMLGDGNIWRNRIRIAFDKRNIIYIEHVFNIFKRIFGINLKREINQKTNQYYLYCNNLFAVEKLIDFGLLRGHKIKNNLGIPEWIKVNSYYSKRCVKGLIDTDGCIYYSKRDKQIYIKFTNFNKRLLRDFKDITNKLDYRFAKANKNNWCLYRKSDVVRFIKEIRPLKSKGMWASLVSFQVWDLTTPVQIRAFPHYEHTLKKQ